MPFELKDLQKELTALEPDHETCISYEVYADLFRPGEPDHRARGRALVFARQNGCKIDNRTKAQLVCFVKKKEVN
jgi:hypothetical protein